jgi:hypothetical protein
MPMAWSEAMKLDAFFEMLPEEAFQKRPGGSMRLWGKGGGSAPAADPNIGIAQRQLADLATSQWDTFKSDIYPEMLRQSKVQEARANEQWAMDKEISTFNLDQSKKAYQRYEEGAIPAMTALKADADKYNEAGYQEQLAGQAQGDINQSFEQQRQNEAMRQRSYGINPNSGAAMGGNNANNVMQAIASAQAATQTREAAHQIGLQKQANVYNMYAGLPAQANMNTTTAMNASGQGMAGTGQALQGTAGVGSSLNSAASTAMGGWNQVGQLGVSKYNADVSRYNAEQTAGGMMAQGLGSAIGSGIALYAKTGGSDITIKQDVKRIGTLLNDIPLYSYEYKPEYRDTWGHGPQVGVMAHEVEHIPGAVSLHADGYKVVDYSKVMNHGI